MDADLDDFHVDSIDLIGVESFGEDEDGYRCFIFHQSMRHTSFHTWGV